MSNTSLENVSLNHNMWSKLLFQRKVQISSQSFVLTLLIFTVCGNNTFSATSALTPGSTKLLLSVQMWATLQYICLCSAADIFARQPTESLPLISFVSEKFTAHRWEGFVSFSFPTHQLHPCRRASGAVHTASQDSKKQVINTQPKKTLKASLWGGGKRIVAKILHTDSERFSMCSASRCDGGNVTPLPQVYKYKYRTEVWS